MDKIRGVNLGNWLVLEKWMSADVFQGTDADDEIWLGRVLDEQELRRRLTEHRNTFYTEKTFETIAAHGLNLVRLPVPYFTFGDRPPYPGCVEWIDKAMDWAEKWGLQIVLDLHTVPGSQNGYDNGGNTGVCNWCKHPDEVEFALTVLERLAERYGQRKGLYGIQVLNEPISWLVYVSAPSTGKARDKEEAKGSGYVPMPFLKQFYRDAYRRIRKYLPEEKIVMFHDGFRLGAWKDFFVREGMKNVILDTHIYIFAMETFVPCSAWRIYQIYVNHNKKLIERAARYTPVVVGEWCIEHGRAAKLARRSGGDEQEQQKLMQQEYQRLAALQLDAWEVSKGWIYWSYQLSADADGPMRINDKGMPMDGWALSRVWRRGWWPERGTQKASK